LNILIQVRMISNKSTGKMGYAIAKAARMRGADITLVTGPTHLDPLKGIHMLNVETAEEMREAVMDNYRDKDVIIKAAAVGDYKPLNKAKRKAEEESRKNNCRNDTHTRYSGRARQGQRRQHIGWFCCRNY